METGEYNAQATADFASGLGFTTQLHTDLEGQLRVTTRDLKDSPRVKNMLSEIETARQPFMDALLTPLLESWAMRAKSKLDPLAADVGLKVADYAEMPVRALPSSAPMPTMLR